MKKNFKILNARKLSKKECKNMYGVENGQVEGKEFAVKTVRNERIKKEIEQGLLKVLKGNQGLPETMSTDEKEDMLETVHNAKDCIATYRSFDGGKVVMGNNISCKVVGICSIQIRMHNGTVKTLTDVRHVSELRKNLISLGTLDSSGYSYRAACGVMRIMKVALVVMKGLKQNSLYMLQGSTVTVTVTAVAASSSDIDSDTTKLWHMRLGHVSERGMDMLSKQDEKDGSHSTEENEEPQCSIARNKSRTEI
ncbi:hypothetical protein RJ640_009539 [Escallonia rubra]|uniref:GAG-pre-integrase domain-containing protein n=1 Tax=Escallonia rubra TaxID=112253 RepID=A0AA88QW74_9ASTE|nr:hypothetical protein RJ640_009539 [Escallonia rubra]